MKLEDRKNKEIMTIKYTCKGSVRGTCGIEHRSISAARECCDRDHRSVKRGNGSNSYSDRSVVRVDGADFSEREQREFAR